MRTKRSRDTIRSRLTLQDFEHQAYGSNRTSNTLLFDQIFETVEYSHTPTYMH